MKKLLKNKNFLILWHSQISSLLTINLLNFLVIVRIYEQTSSTIASSFIWVAYATPAVIVGPFAAAAVDIVDRKKLVVIGNLLQACIIFMYAFLYQKYLFLSYGVIAVYSLLDQVYVPAETAILTRTVSKESLVTANSAFFISQQAATILAFGLAGFANELLGFQLTAILASLFLFSAFVGTIFLPKSEPKTNFDVKANIEEKLLIFLTHMKDGFHFIRRTRSILYPFAFLVWLQVSMSILVVNLPAIATQIVHTKPALAGPLVVLPAGLGAIIGTVIVNKFVGKMGKRKVVHAGLVALSSAFLGVSIVLPLLPFWIGRFALILLFLSAGCAFVATLVPTLTFLQEKTPRNMAGRVFGNFWFVTNALTVLPVIFSATITEVLGARLMLLLLGFVTIAAFFFSRRELNKESL